MSERIFAIHTVFIAKENILFMEEWLDYHLQLGFDRFYLYDNSKVQRPGEWDRGDFNSRHLQPGKVNKYNINYDEVVRMTEAEVAERLHGLTEKYKGRVIITEWSPRDAETGLITYGQEEAFNDCLDRMKTDGVDWCAVIDMDEFIVMGRFADIKDYIDWLTGESGAAQGDNISNVSMSQIRFINRFADMTRLVIDADIGRALGLGQAPKNIFKVDKTQKLNIGPKVLNTHYWFGEGEQHYPAHEEICFNHYMRVVEWPVVDNIHPAIKKTVRRNSRRYLRTRNPGGVKYRHRRAKLRKWLKRLFGVWRSR